MTVQRATLPSLTWLKTLGEAAVDLLFPPRCITCHRLGTWLCAGCQDQIEVIRPPICPRCGLPLADDGVTSRYTLCPRCRESASALDGLCAYAFHSSPLREAIHQLKYEDLQAMALPLGRMMGEGWTALQPVDQDVDVIVPVPLHPRRERERGYNQAGLLARELGACLGRPVVEKVLVRVKATAPQVELNAQARRDNVHGAFRCMSRDLAGQRVLLIDDVCTTGSTLEAACDALREAGVPFVWAYTLARAR